MSTDNITHWLTVIRSQAESAEPWGEQNWREAATWLMGQLDAAEEKARALQWLEQYVRNVGALKISSYDGKYTVNVRHMGSDNLQRWVPFRWPPAPLLWY